MRHPLLPMLLGAALCAGEPLHEMGPAPTRELFPLYLLTLGYRPESPTPLGKGNWRVTLDCVGSNTFEFSEALRRLAPKDPQGRVVMTRAVAESLGPALADVPLAFYFDEEVVRWEFRARCGLTRDTDLWAELPVQSASGGYLDRVIEGFHSLGFEQFGRDQIARDQFTELVLEHGRIRHFNQAPESSQVKDPSLGLVHRFLDQDGWQAAGTATLKLPLTRTYGSFRAGWDHGLAFSARWQASETHVLYAGAGIVRRPPGSRAYNHIQSGGFRNGSGAHLGWEGRPGGRWRPYFQLLWQDGYLAPMPSQQLHRDSLQHDLGVHCQLDAHASLSLRYVNNITHHENTADMSLGLALSVFF